MPKKLTTEEFIRKANIKHNSKYDYSLVRYKNAQEKVKIICPEHGEFEQKAGGHLFGYGCPSCGGVKKGTNESFIKKAEEVHGDKYDYSLVGYKSALKKVKIICPEHGIFEQTPNKHLMGRSCPKCRFISEEEFMERALKSHGDKYDYSKVEFINMNTEIEIICPEHGSFFQIPASHSKNGGCSKCSGKEKITVESFIQRSKKINGDIYDYSLIKEVKNSSTKVPIVCDQHGVFYQTPDGHLNQKHGCPYCKESKGEKEVRRLLKENHISFKQQYTFSDCINPKTGRRLKFDFFLPDLNTCIEYDGKQHFVPLKRFGGEEGLKSSIYRDGVKNKFCKDRGINLIRINYKQSVGKALIKNKIVT